MYWIHFFMNTLYKDHKLYKGDKGTSFMVDNGLHFRICAEGCKFKNKSKRVLCPTQIGIRTRKYDPIMAFRLFILRDRE